MLDVIIKSTKKRIKNEKKQIKKKDLFAQIQNNKNIPFVFEKVLKNEQLSFI
jgi:hypothetical protein